MSVRVGEILGKKKYVLPNIRLHPQICFTKYSPHSHPPPQSIFYTIFPSTPKYVLPNISPHPHTHFMFYSIIPTTPTLIYGGGGGVKHILKHYMFYSIICFTQYPPHSHLILWILGKNILCFTQYFPPSPPSYYVLLYIPPTQPNPAQPSPALHSCLGVEVWKNIE